MYFGEKVKLSHFKQEDGAIFARDQWDETFLDLIAIQAIHPFTEKDWIKVFEEASNNDEAVEFTVRGKEDDKLLGMAGVSDIDHKNQIGEISVGILNAENRNRGFGKETLNLIVEYAFNQLNLRKLILRVVSYNERAIHLYETYGFQQEARFKAEVFHQGQWEDVYRYALFQDDWRYKRESEK
ncbi:GNAT family N-acetyltransferase [Weissella ceti]|uniref:GNAT family N-acetyltransferase n=1 Tax=Weissella ceti TaxID=759620 RepID=A0ABT3E4L3_9LACO|nr:GNAT family protein [Weissella ceti]MCW0953344.1 GNAT family N-acetyltransferase [Weissella ceti]QVK11949.1 GNAT family N-acetyltransferase [Weissella ceti]